VNGRNAPESFGARNGQTTNKRKLKYENLSINYRRTMPTIVMALVLGCFSPLRTAQADADNGHTIVGLWRVHYFVGTQQVNQTFDQWHRDGLEFEVAGIAPGAVCQGTWKRISNDRVKLCHVAWTFDANGALNGYWDETQINTVDSNGNGYHGTFEMSFYDLSGKFLFKNSGTVRATRLSVDD
jgi:hypothetical protein